MMPWFYFDLIVDGGVQGQGAMILEDAAGARDRADALANELRVARPELRKQQCDVRVTDEANEEIYRTPLDPVRKAAPTNP